MQTLLGDGKVGSKFLGDRRSRGVAGVDRLGRTIGFNAGEEQIAGLAANMTFKPKGLRVGVHFILPLLTSQRIGNPCSI